jgi:membrane dipeptidase
MGKNKRYNGYKAFQYLEPDVDYRSFKLAKTYDRVPEYWVPLSGSEEERVVSLLGKSIVISMHEHIGIVTENIERDFIDYQREGREFIGYEALSKSPLDAVFDDMMDGTAFITSKEGWKWSDVINDLGMRLSDIAHQNYLIRCERVRDLKHAHETGRLAMIPSMEGAAPIENEAERIEILFGLGVRKLGLTYSESNALGSGRGAGPRDGGLTDFGYDCVKLMNKIGMAIDVSHCSLQTSLDAIEASSQPVMFSHTGVRALYGVNPRGGLPDEAFQAMAEKGGVAGICAAPHSTWTVNRPEHTIDSFMEHMAYLIDLVGVDYVGAGPDTLYGDHVKLHDVWFNQRGRAISRRRARREQRTEDPEATKPVRVEYVKGIENPTEGMINVTRWLVKNGYSDTEVMKAIGGNVVRFLENVWPI